LVALIVAATLLDLYSLLDTLLLSAANVALLTVLLLTTVASIMAVLSLDLSGMLSVIDPGLLVVVSLTTFATEISLVLSLSADESVLSAAEVGLLAIALLLTGFVKTSVVNSSLVLDASPSSTVDLGTPVAVVSGAFGLELLAVLSLTLDMVLPAIVDLYPPTLA
jgi:hypothetical protein